ncbi:MAG: inorganic pyrophosphatase [Thermoanaerobaculia bacterium]|nr:inorganic pyrophosphatase [Thermoanaerobaculia bacterium]
MSFPKPFYRWRPHPWHGLDVGQEAPRVVNAYIELTPFDRVKYEVDKTTGYLRVDRPQRTSAQPPSLYGFVPRTFCGRRTGELSPAERGDGDPLDICVISEQPIQRAEVILDARVVGGLQMIDGGEADDKIIAVLSNDYIWQGTRDVGELPEVLVERLRHYFATYKLVTGEESKISIETVYDREHAWKVIEASMADYTDEFGD